MSYLGKNEKNEINFLNELIKTHWHIQILAFNNTGHVYEPNSCLPEKMSIENPITSIPPHVLVPWKYYIFHTPAPPPGRARVCQES